MLRTRLTDGLSIRHPIVGAPMAGAAEGRLAHAISAAGGIGMIGVGSTAEAALIAREAAIARGPEGLSFGIGLMAWALERRPELLDAAVAAGPALVSVSFGSPAPYVERLHAAGIRVASQVSDGDAARQAADAGVDFVVAQGTEAGGHTGAIATLPLLQIVLERLAGAGSAVLAAGGIAAPAGVAAALAAGAEGVWVGTAFLASPESALTDSAREVLRGATERDTERTHAFDHAQGLSWPDAWPGRALRNAFVDAWRGREHEMTGEAMQELREARARGDYRTAYLYAGEAVGLVHESRTAGEVVRALAEGAERLLRERTRLLLGPSDLPT